MKKLLKNAGILFMVFALLTACGSKTSTESTDESANEKAATKELSVDEKAKNMFSNTMIIFSGSMIISFSEMYKNQAEVFSEVFNTELDEAAIKELDQKIAGLNDETMAQLEEMKVMMDHAYDSIEKADRAIYDKLFLRESMKNGVAIAESFDMPVGFKPLTEELSTEEVKRYILKIIVDGQDTSDVVIKSFSEIALWMQEIGKELNNDEEINTFMESMKK